MSTPTLSSVAIEVASQYGHLGKLVVDGTRKRARRLVADTNTRYGEFLDRAEQAITTLTAGVHRSVARVAAAAERVDAAFDTKALSTVGTLTLPMAQLSLAIAHRTVQGAERLSARWVGADETAEVAVPVAPPARKGVRRADARA